HHDVPALRPGLTEVELRSDGEAVAGDFEARGDRRGAVGRRLQFGVGQHQLAGEDRREDRQRVDARVEYSEAARLPDPFLARVPYAHVFLPGDTNSAHLGVGKPGARAIDRGRVLRVPGGECGDASFTG